MQLSSIRETQPQKLEFINPHTSQHTDISLMVYPLNSYVGNKAKHEAQLSKIELSKDENNIINGELNPTLQARLGVEMFAKLVHSWDGIEDSDGSLIECNFDSVVKAFSEYEELLNAVFNFSSSLGKR